MTYHVHYLSAITWPRVSGGLHVLFFLSFWKKGYIKTGKCTCDQGKKPSGQTKIKPQRTCQFLPKTSQNWSKQASFLKSEPAGSASFQQKPVIFLTLLVTNNTQKMSCDEIKLIMTVELGATNTSNITRLPLM
jgi:hypothetical protein